MKKLILLLTIVLLTINGFSQTCQWAKTAGNNYSDGGNAVSTDSNGNVFVTGDFDSDNITFGSTTLYNNNSSSPEMFIVKYDVNGNVLWAKSPESYANSDGESVCTDIYGNVYVAGEFLTDSITFPPITLYNHNTTEDFFLVKYDANGNVLWAKSGGGNLDDGAGNLTTDLNGNVFLSGGFYSDSITIENFTLYNHILGITLTADIFLAKYDSNGNVIWAKSFGGDSQDGGPRISAGNNGVFYVSGYFVSDTIYFDSIIIYNISGSDNNYFAKYDSSGNILWVKKIWGNDVQYITSLSSDTNGNIYVGGFFTSNPIHFDSTLLYCSTNIGYNSFIAKYDSTGTLIWVKGAQGLNTEIRNLVTDPNGNSFITGAFQDSAIFGSIILYPNCTEDEFLVKYDSLGNPLWGKTAGCSNVVQSYGINIDGNDNVFITGWYSGNTLSFDTIMLHNNYPVYYDVFVAKYSTNDITGIAEINHEKIAVYPNPSNGNLTLLYSQLLIPNSQFLLKDVFGREVHKQIISGIEGNETINISSLTKGVYFWEVLNNKEVNAQGKLVLIK